jgi:hypothetical protein
MFYFGNNLLYNIRVVNNYYDRKENKMNDILKTLDQAYCHPKPLDGEDGGMLIEDMLEEIVNNGDSSIKIKANASLGECIHYGERIRLYIYIFETNEYLILCDKYEQVEVADGGTCYQGRVEIFKKGE